MRLLLFICHIFLIKSISAQCPMPFAEFEFSILNDGYTVAFEVGNCDPDYTYSWDFGDGATYIQTDPEADPTHVYSKAGTYVVTMVVSLPPPCAQFNYTHTEIITINVTSPNAMWLKLSGPTIAGECQEVIYEAEVTGGLAPYTYSWDMGGHYCTSNCPVGYGNGSVFEGTAEQHGKFSGTGLGDLS